MNDIVTKAVDAIVITGIVIGLVVAVSMTVFAEVNPYNELIQNASNKDCRDLEQVVYWESVRAGAPIETSMAVAEVVMNRVLDDSGDFPGGISKAIRQKGQFSTVKHFNTETIPDMQYEEVCDSICEVVNSNTTILPSKDYVYFDYKKWSWGTDWIWIGETDNAGNPVKGKGMYFGRRKQ